MTSESMLLVDRAMDVSRRLEERGQQDDARVIEQLVQRILASEPKSERPYYTVSEAAKLVGVSGQTIKNWVSRGMLKGYRLGSRVMIPRVELDSYKSLAEAAKRLDPLPDVSEVIEEIRAGRRRFVWPTETGKTEDQPT